MLKASIQMTISDKVGALDDVLRHLRELNINLTRIESRPSRTKGFYDFYLDFLINNPTLLNEVYYYLTE